MPFKASIRSYTGTPSMMYTNPSSTPRAWSSPLSSVAHPGRVATASCSERPRTRTGTDARDSPASEKRVAPGLMAPSTSTASVTRGGNRRITSMGNAASTVNATDAAWAAPAVAGVRMVNRPGATSAKAKRPSAAVVAR